MGLLRHLRRQQKREQWQQWLADNPQVADVARWRRPPRFMRHQLWRQIYVGFIVVVLLVVACGALLFSSMKENEHTRFETHLVPLLSRLLPADAPPTLQQQTLADLAATVHGSVALYAASGEQLATTDASLPTTLDEIRSKHRHFNNLLPLPDGRLLLLRWGAPRTALLGWIVCVVLIIAIGTWPVARRLTRRLERLQTQADAWGRGNLSARMTVDGCDEISELARRFNDAATRVEALVSSQRAMLAAASHELRSPLARIRMAVDLLGEQSPRPDLHQQIEHDIAELDLLIGDLLLASRLADDKPQMDRQSLDLLALAAEEAARTGAEVSGQSVRIEADPRLLRHLIRNLLENARRHAPGSAVEIEVATMAGEVVLQVLDRGPGVPEAESEKIFEPFYRLAGSREKGEGSGYGLALVRRIAQLHGGKVRCLARDGGGSCFELRLRA
ncbi:HAMP domain-containing sensor histidine kinase [Viridibacterium curvum]|uniref:histidine kinase n=1 Tax=Viridibacterium curvum TaxID=1101404 RepID=A0ABP9QI96_9RHOO